MTAQLDIAESLRFYCRLGVDIHEAAEGEDHVKPTSGEIRIASDTVEMLTGILGAWQEPAENRVEIAFKCASAEEINELHTAVVARDSRATASRGTRSGGSNTQSWKILTGTK
jgi:hypothetical protein